jgi:glutamyl-tRNA synthetase
MRNYLARLGWSHGNDEFFTTGQAVAWFDLSHLGKAPARFDYAKLVSLSGQHIRAARDADLLGEIEAFLAVQKKAPLTDDQRGQMLAAMSGLKERARTIPQILDMASFILLSPPFELDAAASKALTAVPSDLLDKLTSRLQNARWIASDLETVVRDFAASEGIGLGKVAQPIRVALSGRTVSLGVFDMMEILGREESLARLEACAKTGPSRI